MAKKKRAAEKRTQRRTAKSSTACETAWQKFSAARSDAIKARGPITAWQKFKYAFVAISKLTLLGAVVGTVIGAIVGALSGGDVSASSRCGAAIGAAGFFAVTGATTGLLWKWGHQLPRPLNLDPTSTMLRFRGVSKLIHPARDGTAQQKKDNQKALQLLREAADLGSCRSA